MDDERVHREELAHAYLRKARQDLVALRHLLAVADVADEIVGFHAQQAVEKALKGVLLWYGVRFRRTHNLRELVNLVQDQGIILPEEARDIDTLTPYAVEFRYGVLSAVEPAENRQGLLERSEAVYSWAESLLNGK